MALENCTLCRGTGWKLVPRPDGAGSVAVACDCGMQERATRVMDRARIPKRYEHCDFESYVTDLTDGKTWMAQHAHSLKQAKLFTQGFVREGTDSPRARRIVLRLPRTAEGNSGKL
jgi:DNA replication protein DnaC